MSGKDLKRSGVFGEANEIRAILETWLQKQFKGKVLSNLDDWYIKPAVRLNKKGRAKWGQLVGIRKDIVKGFD